MGVKEAGVAQHGGAGPRARGMKNEQAALPGPAQVFLARAFRPFFFAAGVFGGLALLVWMLALAGVFLPPSHLGPRDWHVHEMLFGFFSAAMTGFLLTAVPNWTGRMPIMGRPLALLFGLWVAGRLALFFSGMAWMPAVLAAVVDAAFLALLAVIIWREIIAGRNRRNVVVALVVSLLALVNVLFHFGILFDPVFDVQALAERAVLALVAGLIMLIGGRIVPSFTRNWLMKQGLRDERGLPAPFGRFDRLALAAAVLALAAWVAWPQAAVAGALLGMAGVLHLVRLLRWQGWRCLREPLVWVLHAGYLWVAVWLLLMAAAMFGLWPMVDALHALSSGAIGTMTLAVMTRASRGHSGRPLQADGITTLIYVLAIAAAVVRIMAELLPTMMAWHLSASLLLAALWLFAASHAPMFFRPRVDQFPPRR